MSKWLSAAETDNIVAGLGNPQALLRLYGLSLFSVHAIFARDFEPDARWKECIVPTDHAKEYLDLLHRAGIVYPENFETFALFQLFYHHDLFIDYMATDVYHLISVFSELHKTGGARWPYLFGNQLYHKFNDSNRDSRTDHLDADQAEDLLRDTPQGIFQIGNLISGPLGFLESAEYRVLPPSKRALLWHCSDPGCRASHLVTLQRHKSAYSKAADTIKRHIVDNFGPPSEWHGPILHSYRRGKWPNGRPFCDLPAVIGDCIIGEERTRLLVRCFESPYNSALMSAVDSTRSLRGSPEQVASVLTHEEKHQVLLLLRDEDLVKYIDELVANKEIRVPPAELRRRKTYVYDESRDTMSQLSSLGICSTGHPAIVELAATVWSAYDSLGVSDDLSWRLRGHEAASTRHSIVDFVRVHGPERAVKELILASRAVTTAVAEKYVFQIFQTEDEEPTTKRLLWKMGFNLARYEDEYLLLRKRMSEFRECVLQLGSEPTENQMAKVRAVGVNLFVSVETLLENMICYNVWLLTSDHFTGTRFLYNKEDAHVAVTKALGEEVVSGTEKFAWRSDGSNTLGCLLAYMQAFRGWLKQRPNADAQPTARKPEDYPHYAEDTLWVFPFRHVELWADASAEAMATYCSIFERVCNQLGQADLPAVRNGIDHKRDDDKFPDSDKMLACVSRLQQVLHIVDSKRLIPKLFWGVKSESDSYGNTCSTFFDYRGNSVSLWEPSVVLAEPRKRFGTPYLIAPFDFLNQPNSTMVFSISSPSEYERYWKNYPRRRFIPPDVKQVLDEGNDASTGEQMQPVDEQDTAPSASVHPTQHPRPD